MECKRCAGTGQVLEESDNGIGYVPVVCPVCCGRKKVVRTNEQWLGSLAWDVKAYWLSNVCNFAVADHMQKNHQKLGTDFWKKWLDTECTEEEFRAFCGLK